METQPELKDLIEKAAVYPVPKLGPTTATLTNKYEKFYRQRLSSAFRAAGLTVIEGELAAAPNISRPAPMRQYDFMLFFVGHVVKGTVYEAQPHSMKRVMLNTLVRLKSHFKWHQYFRFWLNVQLAEYQGEF